MDKVRIVEILIIQIIIVLLLVFIITSILITYKNIKLVKKFSKYTISSIKNNEVSFLDRIGKLINKLIKFIVKILNKSKIMIKYSQRYDKHLSFDELKNKNGLDILAIKFLTFILFLTLYLITQIVQYKPILFSGILLSSLVGFFILDVFIFFDYKKKRKEVEEDLLKAIIIMNNAFKSGRSTMQAIEIVKEGLTGSISDEFKKIHLDISYGLSIETVFERFYQRIKIEEAKYLSSSLTLLNKTGGNITKVFETIEKEFYNRKRLNNELKTMTSSSIFVYRMLLFVPVFITLIIYLFNNEYFKPFYTNSLGKLILLFIILLYMLYIIIIKRVMKVEY